MSGRVLIIDVIPFESESEIPQSGGFRSNRGERATGEGSDSGRVVEGMKGRRYGRVGR